MGILIDLIIIIIMFSFVFIGYRKGLIKVRIKLLAFIISILIALLFYKPIANQIMINTRNRRKNQYKYI